MGRELGDIWDALRTAGEQVVTEEDYEHGYAREVRGDLRQYVAFRVAGERYAVPIEEVAEICKPMETTPVPRTAPFVVGIGNVRGIVLPIVDLALRLGLGPAKPRTTTRVLIVRRDGESYGLVVDRVSGVIALGPEALEDTPGAIGGQRADFISALARHDDRLMVVLALSELLRPEAFLAAGLVPSKAGR